MGSSISLNKINFEDMQCIIKNRDAVIISTLCSERQQCLLTGTLSASEEVSVLNRSLSCGNHCSIRIVIYGENSCDETLATKYNQLIKLGFTDVHVYMGGMFEWLLLQDIYGKELFPTTTQENDLLKFKGRRKINFSKLLES
tara:strand:- start:908 stop:1333 length:426 start_codon:yes stop_codon:yes gene_type:complete